MQKTNLQPGIRRISWERKNKLSQFPVFEVGTTFTSFEKIGALRFKPKLKYGSVQIKYPLRLNGMSIDASAITKEGATFFPAGEVFFSIEKFVEVDLTVSEQNGIIIDKATKRKSLIIHACRLMEKAFNIKLNLNIRLKCSVPKHVGFGSSGAIIGAICAGVNEIYGNPINQMDLLEYITKNYGEEVDDEDIDRLKLVQCIGGSVASGLVDGGVCVITGEAVPIMSAKIKGKVLTAIPKDFIPKTAKELMEIEEENLDRFDSHGKNYANEIAYNLLHKGLPELKKGKIGEVCNIIFRHRFEMGSIQNCAFVYPRVNEVAKKIRFLYDNGYCQLVSMSSVGPAFFVILNDKDEDKEKCKRALLEQDLIIEETRIWNSKYQIKYNKELK